MNYIFTSESVSSGHPDKIADQISDSVLDNLLAYDEDSRVACETLVTTGQVILAGEVKSKAYVDLQQIARDTINSIGYTKSEYQFDGDSCGVLNAIHEQSDDISRGVDNGDNENQGSGDQGIMFGLATNETKNYMPLTIELAHAIVKKLEDMRRAGDVMTYLRPDAKSQVSMEYTNDGTPVHIDTIVVSTQHDELGIEGKELQDFIENDVRKYILTPVFEEYGVNGLFDGKTKVLCNPTGKFVIGGPHGDTGLTGRKIIVDTYGGHGSHGGGCFSGKDSSKVDRSAAYEARHIAKNLVAAGVSDKVLVQLSYAIGVAQPVSIYVDTYGKSHVPIDDGEIGNRLLEILDLRPKAIEKRLGLRLPIYSETAAYGHMGRVPKKVVKTFHNRYYGDKTVEVELFTWEKLDYVETFKKEFSV